MADSGLSNVVSSLAWRSDALLDVLEVMQRRFDWVRADLAAGDFARLAQSVGFVDSWNEILKESLAHVLKAAAREDIQS